MKFKKMISLGSALFVGLLSHAYAGNEGAHGGGAILCENSGSIELLDHYEGRMKTGLALDMGGERLSYQEKIALVLDRLTATDPLAAARFREHAAQFESEMQLVEEAQLKTIADTDELLNPLPGCSKVQFAVQVANPKPYEKRYFVNRRLWNKADSTALAGLVLHEVVYRHAIQGVGHSNSDGTRYYSFMISSTVMGQIDNSRYEGIIAAAGFESSPLFSVAYQGVLMSTGSSSIRRVHENQKIRMIGEGGAEAGFIRNLRSAKLDSNQRIIEVSCHDGPSQWLTLQGFSLEAVCSPERGIQFHPLDDFKVKTLTVRNTIQVPSTSGTVPLEGVLQFDESAKLVSGELASRSWMSHVQGQAVVFKARHREENYGYSTVSIEFHPGGQLKRGMILGGVSLRDASNQIVELPGTQFADWYSHHQARYIIELDEKGSLLDWKKVRHHCGGMAPFGCSD